MEQDLAEIYDGEVRYARDAFEGLRLMDAVMAGGSGFFAGAPYGPAIDGANLAVNPAVALANDPRVIESYLGLGQKH